MKRECDHLTLTSEGQSRADLFLQRASAMALSKTFACGNPLPSINRLHSPEEFVHLASLVGRAGIAARFLEKVAAGSIAVPAHAVPDGKPPG